MGVNGKANGEGMEGEGEISLRTGRREQVDGGKWKW
jgi:hypothetical protein